MFVPTNSISGNLKKIYVNIVTLTLDLEARSNMTQRIHYDIPGSIYHRNSRLVSTITKSMSGNSNE